MAENNEVKEVNVNELVQEFIDKCRKNGKIAMKEISKLAEELDLDNSRQDAIIDALEKMSVKIEVEEEDLLNPSIDGEEYPEITTDE